MSLTSPLIDQAIAQVCAFVSPFLGILSAMGIFRQLTIRVPDLRLASGNKHDSPLSVQRTASLSMTLLSC